VPFIKQAYFHSTVTLSLNTWQCKSQAKKRVTNADNLNAVVTDSASEDPVGEGSVVVEKPRQRPQRPQPRPVQQMAIAMDEMGPRRSN
jgi:hypothetical protein